MREVATVTRTGQAATDVQYGPKIKIHKVSLPFITCEFASEKKFSELMYLKGCLVQVGNGTELEAVGLQFEPSR